MKLIITGASKGIGKAIALRFAREGWDIAFCGRNASELEQLAAQMQADYGIRAFGLVADISVKEEARAFADAAVLALGGCDVLINNAGMYMPGSIELEADGVFEYQMAVNLNSAYYVTQRLIPALKKGKRPHIFSMCSIASIKAYPNGSSYCISKFALLGMTKVLREELKPAGIGVTAIMPGATLTESWGESDLPETRFIKPANIAESIYTAWSVNENAVVEELMIRPLAGDI